MTPKRFWMLFTFAGALVFVAGLVLTIVLTIETGQEQPDSACDSSMGVSAKVVAFSCYTSNDPKVLLGIAPLLLGGGMVGIGIWRWVVSATRDSSSGGGGVMMDSIQALQDQATQAMGSSGTISSGGMPPTPPASPPPETHV